MSVQNSAHLKVLAREYRKVYTLQRKSHLCISRKGIARPQSLFLHSCVCERFISFQDWSTYFSAAEYINRSLNTTLTTEKSFSLSWNKLSFTLFGRVSAAETFLQESINRAQHIRCSQINNGAAFVPDSETSLQKSGNFTLSPNF
jgi:hypothetical protein